MPGGHVLDRDAVGLDHVDAVRLAELAVEDDRVAVLAADRQVRRRDEDGLVVVARARRGPGRRAPPRRRRPGSWAGRPERGWSCPAPSGRPRARAPRHRSRCVAGSSASPTTMMPVIPMPPGRPCSRAGEGIDARRGRRCARTRRRSRGSPESKEPSSAVTVCGLRPALRHSTVGPGLDPHDPGLEEVVEVVDDPICRFGARTAVQDTGDEQAHDEDGEESEEGEDATHGARLAEPRRCRATCPSGAVRRPLVAQSAWSSR